MECPGAGSSKVCLWRLKSGTCIDYRQVISFSALRRNRHARKGTAQWGRRMGEREKA
jgi:hypothetical protein